ncbi:MAG: IS5 family transposase [Candidatus Binataceae bacterium]|nr:IS5 family transposase [Candidatus Binataceae bacterium]
MRGVDHQQSGMFSYISAERRVPKDHPLRAIRVMVDEALKESSWRFDAVYASSGRPSIPPEKLLRALLLQMLYTVRSERLLMEQLDYNFLFRWFVGLNIDDPVWDVTVFTKNRERLLVGEVAQGFFNAVVEQANAQGLLSNEHFTVDGTLIEAWAGHKSFKRKGDDRPTPPDDPGNPSVDFHGERRTNATHQSTTDPDARLARKGPGKEARLCYAGHVQMDNRHGLVVNTRLTQASGSAEPTAALAMAAEIVGQGRVTLGADKGYDQKELVRALREYRVTPHVAQKVNSAIDRRSTRHPGYRLSQRRRKRVEEIFGWLKTVAGLRKTRHRGIARVGWTFTFAAAAYNLVRMRNLLPVVT